MAYKKEEKKFDPIQKQIEEVMNKVMQKCLDENLSPWQWYLLNSVANPHNAYTNTAYRGTNAWVCSMLGVQATITERQLEELKDKLAGFKPNIEDYYVKDKRGRILTEKDRKTGKDKPKIDWKKYYFDQRMAYKAFRDNGGVLPKRKLYPTLDADGNQIQDEHGKPMFHYADGIPIYYTGLEPRKDEDGEVITDENGNEVKKWFSRLYWVIDCREIEGYDFGLSEDKEKPSFEDNLEAERIFNNYVLANNIKVEHIKSYGASSYSPGLDRIKLSEKIQYTDEGAYYQTFSHEAGHSTGASNRLNRVGVTKCEGIMSRSDNYAEEELVAEFCSIFCMMALGIDHYDDSEAIKAGGFENSCAYIKSWWKHLKDDPNKFSRACNAGYRAFEYIFSFSKPESNEKVA